MNKKSIIYQFLKKCEVPPNGSIWWMFLSLSYNISVILIGYLLLLSLKHNKKSDIIVLCPSRSNGDILLLYRSLELLKKNNNLNKIQLVLEENLFAVAEMLDIGDSIPLSKWKRLAISKAASFFNTDWIIDAYPWVFFDVSSITQIEMLNHAPFNLHAPQENEIFVKKNPSGKCVILSPYEQSISNLKLPKLSNDFWICLSENLNHKGFNVLTNCNGKDELPILGTDAIFPRLVDLSGFVEYAGYSISVRSGFADWCSSAPTAKQVVLYPNRAYLNRSGMKHVWGRQDILELVYGDASTSEKEIIRIIMNYIESV